MCIKSIYDIWRLYHLNSADERMAALINPFSGLSAEESAHQLTSVKAVHGQREKQRQQVHQGYVVSETDRWGDLQRQGEFSKMEFARVEVPKR